MPVQIAHGNGEHPTLKRYKHSLRKAPYLVSLILLLLATTFTLLNIYVPDLVDVVVTAPGPLEFETRYGLYKRCVRKTPLPQEFLRPSQPLADPSFEMFSRAPELGLMMMTTTTTTEDPAKEGQWQCQDFPTRSECQQFGEQFCVLWSTAGYAAQSSLVPCLVSLFSLLFIFLHRGQRTARARARRQQWKLVSVTMGIHCLLQILSIAMILHVFRTDERFSVKGSKLHMSFAFGVVSAVVSASVAIGLTYAGLQARKGKPWAAGVSALKARRHRRTRSGRVVPVPEGQQIPAHERVTVGEVEVVLGRDEAVDERTALLAGVDDAAAGGGSERATD